MLLLSGLAAAADLTTVLALNDQRWTTTWAEVAPGPLPAVVLKDGAREVRVELSVVQLVGVDVVVDFVAREVKGRKTKVLWEGRIEAHEPRSAAVFMAQGKDGTFQLIAAPTSPEPLPDGMDAQHAITTGPLAGCQWMRRGEATVVTCPDAMVLHRAGAKMDAAAVTAEVEALRARVGAERISDEELPLTFDGVSAPGHRMLIRGDDGDGLMLTAWFAVGDGTHQVGAICAAAQEDACRARLGALRSGLPAEIR